MIVKNDPQELKQRKVSILLELEVIVDYESKSDLENIEYQMLELAKSNVQKDFEITHYEVNSYSYR